MSLLATLAIVAVPHTATPPPAPATASPQQNCEYSLMINDNPRKPIYKCYTAEEYQQKISEETAVEAKNSQELASTLSNGLNWIVNNWWKVLLIAFWVIVLLVILTIVIDVINIKRHPEDYDENGFRKGTFYD
jgi:hypothetical protein